MTIVKVLADHIMGLQHVGHVVRDLDAAVAAFCRLYGLTPSSVRYVPDMVDSDTPTRFAFVSVADTEFELIEPLSESFREILFGSQSGGAGINHVAWRVRDLDACLELLAELGIGPGHVTPDGPVAFKNRRLVYLDPSDCDGLLVELIEINDDE